MYFILLWHDIAYLCWKCLKHQKTRPNPADFDLHVSCFIFSVVLCSVRSCYAFVCMVCTHTITMGDELNELHSFLGSLPYLQVYQVLVLIGWLVCCECRPVGDDTVQGGRHCQHVRPGGKAVVLPSLAGSRCQLRQTPRYDSRLHDAGESWFRPIHQWPLTSLCLVHFFLGCFYVLRYQ